MAKHFYILMLLAASAAAQTVTGSVFDAATGTGVGGVKVELLKGATAFYETTTDGGGRFRFDNVREGDYAARYQSPDYWLTAGPSDYQVFAVAAGSPVNLEARLMPWSKISGRVVDGRGNGVANARLELTGSGMLSGNRTYLRTSWGGGGGGRLGESPLRMPFFGSSDAQGKFEVQLMPGTYGLSVLPPPDLKPPEPEPEGPVLAWARSYYPSAALPEAASKIVVLPAGEVSVELKLLAVPAHAVRGVLVYPDGTLAPKVAITMGDFGQRSVESKPDGTFEFAAVPEGEWRFAAQVQRGGIQLRAAEWIAVTKHDIESLKLRLVPPVTVRGKVVMEVEKGSPLPRLPPMILALRAGRFTSPEDMGLLVGGSGPMSPDANGNFSIQAYPGVYQISPMLPPPPPPYYLDAVRVGDADLLTQEVEFSTSDVALTVVYKTDGGSVRGTAENCASGGVMLIPRDPPRRRGFSRSGPCDSNDRYEVRTVRPGEYYAVALAGNGPVLAVDEVLLNQAVKVTVRASEASTADLRTITRPVY